MNPKPTSSMQRADRLRRRGRCGRPAPRARRPSPRARSPSGCRAWPRVQPAPAAISAAVVETLKVLRGRRRCRRCRAGRRRRRRHGRGAARASCAPGPASSSTVSPLVRSAIRKPAIWISDRLAGHDLGERRRASGLASGPGRSASASIARVSSSRHRTSAAGSSPAAPCPCSVSTDSGWNCTPSAGSSRWRTAITTLAAEGAALEHVGQLGVGDQRVVAPDLERSLEAGEDRLAVMLDHGRLAVHGHVGDHLATPRLHERLMAEADAERRDPGEREAPDRLE